MINFKFVKSQFKIIWIELIAFFALLLFFSIMVLMQNTFSETIGVDTNFGLFGFMFLIPAMFLLPIFVILLVYKLLLKEINKGYFSSWLVASMSRKTILNSKFFVIVSAIVMLNMAVFLSQLILFFARYSDFNLQLAWHLFLFFLTFTFASLIITSLTWIISCHFCSKPAIAISIVSAIMMIFMFFYVLGNVVSKINDLGNFKYFNYFTIWTFLKPITLFSLHNPNPEIKSLIFIKAFDIKNFAWQLPVMLVLIGGLFVSGNLIFVKKDLQL